ncbi:MAG: hypothetical protein IMW91_06475 [Firmicutes bacterium]|nr:hypothetical protein [Bacillota bacterium]
MEWTTVVLDRTALLNPRINVYVEIRRAQDGAWQSNWCYALHDVETYFLL